MQTVAISFKNGTKMRFFANEFDIDLAGAQTQVRTVKFTYQDHNGEEALVYLNPGEVARIVVSPVTERGRMSIDVS